MGRPHLGTSLLPLLFARDMRKMNERGPLPTGQQGRNAHRGSSNARTEACPGRASSPGPELGVCPLLAGPVNSRRPVVFVGLHLQTCVQ